MDVTCQQCHTEYEFDETLVSDRGTTVKCTNCGHLFKVRRASPASTQGSETRVSWRVRGRDLSVRQVHSLRELQELITDGQFGEDDEISRSGAAFKRLGSIGELRPFFLAAQHLDAAPASRRQDRPTPSPYVVGQGGPNGTLKFAGRPGATELEESPDHLKTVAAPGRSQSLANRTRPLTDRPPRPRSEPLISERKPGTVLGLGRRPSEGPRLQIADEPRRDPTGPQVIRTPAHNRTRMGLGRKAVPAMKGSTATTAIDTIPDEAFETQPTQAVAAADSSILGRPAATTRGQTPRRRKLEQDRVPADPHRIVSGGPNILATRPGEGQAEGEDPKPQPTAAPARASTRRSLYVEEGDLEVSTIKTGFGVSKWIGITVLLGLVSAGTYWAVEEFGGNEKAYSAPPAEVARAELALQRGEVGLILDSLRRLESLPEQDSNSLRLLASLHSAVAQMHIFEAMDLAELERRSASASTDKPRQARLKARAHSDKASFYSEQALEQEPNNPGLVLVRGNALRLSGKLSEARTMLTRYRLATPDGSADASYLEALLAMDQQGEDASYARPAARLAARQDREHLRARLLLARGELAARDVAAAKQELEAIIKQAGSHAGAQVLLQAIENGSPPAPPVLEIDETATDPETPEAEDQEAGEPEPAPDSPAEDQAAAAPSTGEAAATAAGGPDRPRAGAPRCRDSDCYTGLGAAAQARGDSAQARHYFEQALALDPGDPEANAGLGKAYLAAGNLSAAVGLLRVAARANYSDSALVLGAALRRAGRFREAREAYQSYLNRNPGGRYATAAERALEALGPATVSPEEDPAEAPGPATLPQQDGESPPPPGAALREPAAAEPASASGSTGQASDPAPPRQPTSPGAGDTP